MSEETLLDRYFAENLQMVCAPVGLSQPDPPVRSDSDGVPASGGNDPAAWIAGWIAKSLTPHQPEGGATTSSGPEAAHPLLAQVIQQVIGLGKIIYAETCRQLSAPPADNPPSQPAAPVPVDTGSTAEKVTNLTAARDAREREIFLQAMQDCRTIRQLTEYLQTSPATVLRKLKKHGLSL